MDENIKLQIEKIRKDCETIKPLVVIRCITYNHKNYIKDALEGFVNQKTSFPYVAIIHDDTSTDGTDKLIQEYAEKYPKIIMPIYEIENQYSKHDGSLGKIVNEASKVTGATYIALCEGDDYWIDENKLQKQVDFLEAHPDYSMCFHRIKPIGSGLRESDNIFDRVETKEYFPKDLLTKWIVQTASLVIRREVYEKKPNHPDFCIGDNVLLATCISNGRIYGFEDLMGVYRRMEEGWTLGNRRTKEQIFFNDQRMIKHYKRLNTFFPDLKVFYDQRIMRFMNSSLIICLTTGRGKEALEIIKNGLKEYKLRYLGSLLSFVYYGVKSKIISR